MKIFVKTYGCSLNLADSESMAGILKNAGHEIIDNLEDADAIIVNTCIVKKPTEQAVFKYLEDLPDKPTVIAGCMPQVDNFSDNLKKYSLVGTDHIHEIVHVLEETVEGNRVVMIGREKNERLNLPRVRRNEIVEIIPISKGCLGDCAYCIVRRARGPLVSYDMDAIVSRVELAVKEGVKEIWLTSQDCGAYGKDIDKTLPELLKAILKLNGEFKVRLGMANPNFIYEYLTELIELFKNEKMFQFLHIPVQSGSDKILKKMNRKYEVEDFRAIVQTFREEIPDISIATDFIVGFPGESKKDFGETILLVEELYLDVLNISRFFPRPGTKAAEMIPVDGAIIKDRSRELTKKFHEFAKERNTHWATWQGNILIDEEGKNNTMIGRNHAYKPVVVKGKFKLGETVFVKIVDSTQFDLRGIIE